ncbi:MAG: AIR synthase related protein [Candidatus Hadarchaeia archaeon]
MSSKYEKVGVDARKKGIEVFESTIENIFPNAFCTVGKDPDIEENGMVLHSDSAGSKPVQNYLQWRETEDLKWFKSIPQDVIAMNLDDILCVGAKPISFIDYIAINKKRFPKKELLSVLNEGFREVFRSMEKHGLGMSFLGGETADLPDQMKTIDVCGTLYGRVKLSDAITGEDVEPGNLIVGLRSGGKASYEDRKNSGILCNGITLARHCLLKEEYEKKYPEIGSEKSKYYGKYSIEDSPKDLDMSIGEAIVSPTRIYAPIIHEMLEKLGEKITGLVHNTGGGQTKDLAIGKNIHYIKDGLFEPDPIFQLIKSESGESWRNMYEDYNMGSGFEVIVDKEHAKEVVEISKNYEVEAKVIGRCERNEKGNKVSVKSEFGKFVYEERDQN